MGRLRSRIGPYFPKISRKWPSLTFLLNCSTTIYIESALSRRIVVPNILTFALLGAGEPLLRLGLREKLLALLLGVRDRDRLSGV
jgi:hypothetical protein